MYHSDDVNSGRDGGERGEGAEVEPNDHSFPVIEARRHFSFCSRFVTIHFFFSEYFH